MEQKLGFDTLLLHAGYKSEERTKSRAVPLYMTTAYSFDSVEHARSLFALEQGGNIYTRLQNPTSDVLEQRISALEGGIGALATSSGHAAELMTILCLASSGDEIVSSSSIYGGTINLFGKTLKKMGITTKFVNSDDPDEYDRATNEKTKAYFVEVVGNPNANVSDIAAISKIAKKHGIPLIVDNTMTTPFLIKPIEYGADIVIHSTTKYLSGNGTVMGGVAVDSGKFQWRGNPRFPEFNEPDPSYHGIVYADIPEAAFITKLRTHILRDVGACQSPFNSWVTLLGMETLSLRMERHCENADKVASFLEKNPRIKKVNYPRLPSSPYYELTSRQLKRGAGSTFTFEIDGTRENGAKFIDSLKLVSHVANLGDSRTLVSNPAATTHSQLSDDQLKAAGISPTTIRLSVGLETAEDIISDIEQALKAAF
ncbi:MAG: O-acetylhomoserine aminocarboxypropyltransferase/cysteine synthase [Clostridiales bacterium]|nr:O-acetylhomoserine aminocarboxypropyltransferase/cysteine synthase [Clostridiales bacterium]